MSNSAAAAREALDGLLKTRLGDRYGWITESLDGLSVDTAGRVASGAGRACGKRPLVGGFADRERATVEGPHGTFKVGHWRTDEAARALLLAAVAQGGASPFQTLFEIYDQGDTETRVAALRAINLVDDSDVEKGLELVHDAGRTYLDVLLTAAWCDNPFSATHLTDHDYRKAVLKALFCEVSVDGFLRLEERADAELAQSLCEYADERLAAGRTVPAAVWVVSAMHPRPGLIARLVGMLEHPLPVERLTAARALAHAKDARAKAFIEERLEREDDPQVREALRRAGDAS
jgi:hypothetical protein